MKFEFKELEIGEESKQKTLLQSAHIKKSLLFIALGAIGGFLFFYFTEGQQMDMMTTGQIIKSLLIGGFFGFFITNSPCARNKC